MQFTSILPLDAHDRLPRMHYDALWKPSPTTRSDVLAWCVAQRKNHGVSTVLRGAVIVTMGAVMANKAPQSRLDDLPIAQLGAIEAAADEIYAIVREYGYDPTGVEQFKKSCMTVIMDKIDPLICDLSPAGAALDSMPLSIDLLREAIGVAAVGTTLVPAFTGQMDAQAALNAVLLAFDESDDIRIKDFLAEAVTCLKQEVDRKREG